MRFQLGIQVLLLVVAATIVFTIIRPKIVDIGSTQNEVASYRDALDNIGRYNQRLQTLINQLNSMPSSDRSALFRYLPEDIDVVKVSADITNIVERNRLLMLDLTFDQLTPVTAFSADGTNAAAVYQRTVNQPSGVTGTTSGEQGLYSQRFSFEAVGTYEQMKAMLKDFERNSYPLRLLEFSFSLEEASSGLIQYSVTLETYALPNS